MYRTYGNYTSYADFVTANRKFEPYTQTTCMEPVPFSNAGYSEASLTPTVNACRQSYITTSGYNVCQSVPSTPQKTVAATPSAALASTSSFAGISPLWSSKDFVYEQKCKGQCGCICEGILQPAYFEQGNADAGRPEYLDACMRDCSDSIGAVEKTYESDWSRKYVGCLDQCGYDQDCIQRCVNYSSYTPVKPAVIPSGKDNGGSGTGSGTNNGTGDDSGSGKNNGTGDDSGSGKNDGTGTGTNTDGAGVSCDSLTKRTMVQWAAAL